MPSIDELWARESVRDLYSRYCFALDSNLAKELGDCFTEDGVFALVGVKDFEGRPAIIDLIAGTTDNRPRHHALNLRIRKATADRVESEAYFLLIHQQTGNTVAYGHYEDSAVKDADSVWRFDRRVVDFHWRGPEYGTRVDDIGHRS